MDPSTFIFDDDFLSICPGKRLASSVLYVAMSQLVSSRPGSIVLDPSKVFMARKPTTSRDAVADLQNTLSTSTRLKSDGNVFIPILIRGHYTLAVVRHADKTICYYDSCGGSSPGASSIVAQILPDTQDASWTHSHAICFIQLNHYDCGVSVFLNTLHLVLDPNLQDVAAQVSMQPQDSCILYWLAGRTAILEYCKPAVPQTKLIEFVEKALTHAQTLAKDDKGSEIVHGGQLRALSKVCFDFQALAEYDGSNMLIKATVGALQNMVSKLNPPES